MKLIHEETMCCGYKRCPKIRIFEDGSVEISDDDPQEGSVGTIKLKPRTADRLVELLSERME